MVNSLMFVLIVCLIFFGCACFLLISRRKIRVKLQQTETLLSESKALFNLSQEENSDLKRRLDGLSVLISQKDVALERESAALNWAKQSLQQTQEELDGTKKLLSFEQEQYKKLIGQKKSSEVRTGKIAEQISPFLESYPLNPKNARFLGDPLDFVSFDDDKITFVEVKSGKSQLNKRQRHFRDLIKEGKVEFLLYRIKGE